MNKSLGIHFPVSHARPRNLRGLALRGSAWTIAGYGASQLLRLGSNLILTRLLIPEAFGLMTLVNVFLQALQMFSDLGIGPSIIQNRNGVTNAFLNTAWTLQISRGFALWLLSCVIAWPVATIYHQSLLSYLLPAAGLNAAITGFQSTSLFVANREMRLGTLTVINLISQTIGIVVMVGVALVQPSVWSLLAGGLASSIATVALGFRLIPSHPHRLVWDRLAAQDLVRFGRWIMLGTVLTFVANQGDRLVMGKLLTMEQLGIVGIAAVLARLPADIVRRVADRVLLPVLAHVHREEQGQLRPKLAKARLPLNLLMLGTSIGLGFGGDSMISYLYPKQYHEAGWIVQLMALGPLLEAVHITYSRAFLAVGKPQVATVTLVLSIMGRFGGMAIGAWSFGLPGLILGVSVGGWLAVPATIYYAKVFELATLRDDSAIVFVGLVAASGILVHTLAILPANYWS